MNTLFPETPREQYSEAPLVQVVCQLKFPKLLKIDSAPPVEFQERIRQRFPLMQKLPNLPINLPPEVAQLFAQQTGVNNYQFVTEDTSQVIALNSDTLSLATSKYKDWKSFEEVFFLAFSALNEIYQPSFFTRIGLRYVDAIDRAKLGLGQTPWSRLLNPSVLGELSRPEFENNLEGMASRAIRLKNPDGSGSILFQHGLAHPDADNNFVYVFDIDFFTETKTEVNNVTAALKLFNHQAGNAFRWCITDELKAALKPASLPS